MNHLGWIKDDLSRKRVRLMCTLETGRGWSDRIYTPRCGHTTIKTRHTEKLNWLTESVIAILLKESIKALCRLEQFAMIAIKAADSGFLSNSSRFRCFFRCFRYSVGYFSIFSIFSIFRSTSLQWSIVCLSPEALGASGDRQAAGIHYSRWYQTSIGDSVKSSLSTLRYHNVETAPLRSNLLRCTLCVLKRTLRCTSRLTAVRFTAVRATGTRCKKTDPEVQRIFSASILAWYTKPVPRAYRPAVNITQKQFLFVFN